MQNNKSVIYNLLKIQKNKIKYECVCELLNMLGSIFYE